MFNRPYSIWHSYPFCTSSDAVFSSGSKSSDQTSFLLCQYWLRRRIYLPYSGYSWFRNRETLFPSWLSGNVLLSLSNYLRSNFQNARSKILLLGHSHMDQPLFLVCNLEFTLDRVVERISENTADIHDIHKSSSVPSATQVNVIPCFAQYKLLLVSTVSSTLFPVLFCASYCLISSSMWFKTHFFFRVSLAPEHSDLMF